MDPSQQFWWNWWVNLAVATGTLLTVAVALFGEKLRAKLFPPVLRMRLLRKEGEKTELRNQSGQYIDDVRYYHLKVWNERRWSTAEQVQVYLTRIDEPGPSGKYQLAWSGEVPLRWRDQEFVPLLQTIGAAKDCDFFMVQKKGGLWLMPLITPNNMKARKEGKCRFLVWVQARSDQADSEIMRIQVSWDGLWEYGDTEMQRHLEVEDLAPRRK